MNRQRLMWSALLVLLFSGLAQPVAFAQPAPQCTVAVTSGGGGLELPQLHSTLTALGFAWVDIASVADAQTANADVIIDRYDASNLPAGDVTTWLNSGRGYIQLGDWPAYFPNSFVAITNGAPITISIADPTSPLAAGLPASWTGRGFWAYDSGSDYLGWTTNAALPDVAHADYSTSTYTRVVSSELVGTGRAVYIGFNVYGSAAGPNDTRLLRNAISWAGGCALIAEAVPTLGGVAMAVLMVAIAMLGVILISRLR